MPREIVYYPPESRPTGDALAMDLIGRYLILTAIEEVLAVIDLDALPEGKDSSAAMIDLFYGDGDGAAPLSDLIDVDVVVWRGGHICRVRTTARNVNTTFITETGPTVIWFDDHADA